MAEKKANIKKQSVGRKDMFLLPHGDLTVDHKWNERNRNRPEVKEHIENIAAAIMDGAEIPPLLVRAIGDKILVRDGYCRHAAYGLAIERGADIPGIPVMPAAKGTNEADDIAAMLGRNNGLDFTFAEQARVVKRLLGAGWSKQDIATKTSKSPTHVDNCIIVLEAHFSHDIMKLLDNGKVSMRLAVDTIRKKGEYAAEMLKDMVKKAESAGKKKATARTAKGSYGQPIKTINGKQWAKHGPELLSLLEALDKAYEAAESVPDPIADVVNYYREYKEDNNLVTESEG
jgi:hypothetical protein